MIDLNAAARSSSKEGIGCQLTASPPSYLKANPIKIIILTSALHQACLDDTSTQAKRTSICQCLPIEKRFYFNRMDCDQFQMDTRVCNTLISSHPRQGIHLAVVDPNVKLCCTQQHFHHRLTSVVYKIMEIRAIVFVYIHKTECQILKK